MVAALGSGFAYSLVSAGLQGQPGNAIATAAGFALFQGVFFKVSDYVVDNTLLEAILDRHFIKHMFSHIFLVFFQLGERFSKPTIEDPYYTRARSMLLKLGLEKYEKNFKKGLLADPTLPLLTDRY